MINLTGPLEMSKNTFAHFADSLATLAVKSS